VRFYYQQNLHKEDYFWESKRILSRPETELKPQKAFLILTSGLVQNLAFEEKRTEVDARRERAALSGGPEVSAETPGNLGFICFHLRYRYEGGTAELYFLIEPSDPAAPTLFRTQNWDLNCIAPRFGNDPISYPPLAPHLRALEHTVRALDTVSGERLRDFWLRHRAAFSKLPESLPKELEVVRVFGE
jgi:hypothetical protein